MGKPRRPQVEVTPGSHVPQSGSAEGPQSLPAGLLQNLNQFLVTQTQLMQQMMQCLNANNVCSTTAPAALEECAREEQSKDKSPEAPHNEVVSHSLPEARRPWKYILCYICGEPGHFAYRCPQRGKPKQEVHCANCKRIGHLFSRCSKKKVIPYQVCNRDNKVGHSVKQCPLQANSASQSTPALKGKSEEPESSHQGEINCSRLKDQVQGIEKISETHTMVRHSLLNKTLKVRVQT